MDWNSMDTAAMSSCSHGHQSPTAGNTISCRVFFGSCEENVDMCTFPPKLALQAVLGGLYSVVQTKPWCMAWR